MKPTHHTTHSVRATETVAAEFAKTLRGGECIALDGPLGAGKTQYVRGLVQGLGGDGRTVSSPTYVLLNIYDTGRLTVYHLDAYRVTGDDLEATGFTELLEQNGVVIVEWPSRAADLLPSNTLHIRLHPTGPTTRRIDIENR
jgi:tRNA threonylcarbamoyladenosine biosynthesis protein TsaE